MLTVMVSERVDTGNGVCSAMDCTSTKAPRSTMNAKVGFRNSGLRNWMAHCIQVPLDHATTKMGKHFEYGKDGIV